MNFEATVHNFYNITKSSAKKWHCHLDDSTLLEFHCRNLFLTLQ